MSYQIQEINRRIQADPKEFVDACDAAYAEKIERAARAIAENVRTCPIVLLSGPSGSGKTTTAMKIAEALRGMGIGSQSLAMDDYFRTVNPRTAPRTPQDHSCDIYSCRKRSIRARGTPQTAERTVTHASNKIPSPGNWQLYGVLRAVHRVPRAACRNADIAHGLRPSEARFENCGVPVGQKSDRSGIRNLR